MNAEARFCSHCGKPMPPQSQQAWNPYAGRIVRPLYGRMIGGVCAGFSQHYGWDPVLVRVLVVVLFFVGCGSILLAYIAAWIIMPNEPYFFVPPTYGPPPGYPESAPRSTYGDTPGSAPIS